MNLAVVPLPFSVPLVPSPATTMGMGYFTERSNESIRKFKVSHAYKLSLTIVMPDNAFKLECV